MEPAKEQYYLELANTNADVLCRDAPVEILEDAAFEAEPTPFMEQYFAAGHASWLAIKYGRRIGLPAQQMNRAILVLWLRACLLNTDRELGMEPRDGDKPFFSDDGLY